MRIELTLGGADQIKSAFRQMSDELDKLNKKIDSTTSKLGSIGSSFNSSSSMVDGPSGSSASPLNTIKVPPVISPKSNASSNAISNMAGNAIGKHLGVSGQIVKFAGDIVGKLGKFGTGLTIATLGLYELTKAGIEAAKEIREYGQYSLGTRGKDNQKEALAGLSQAAGVGLDEASGLANSKAGGARQLINELDQYRKIKSDQEAQRFAQTHGIEGYSRVRDMITSQWQRALNVNQPNRDEIRLSNRNEIESQIAGNNIDTAKRKIAVPFSSIGTSIQTGAMNVENVLLAPFAAGAEKITKWLNGLTDNAEKKSKKTDDAAQKQLDAAHINADSANKIREGVYGGGSRARNVMPAAWGWYNQSVDLSRDTKNLGGIM